MRDIISPKKFLNLIRLIPWDFVPQMGWRSMLRALVLEEAFLFLKYNTLLWLRLLLFSCHWNSRNPAPFLMCTEQPFQFRLGIYLWCWGSYLYIHAVILDECSMGLVRDSVVKFGGLYSLSISQAKVITLFKPPLFYWLSYYLVITYYNFGIQTTICDYKIICFPISFSQVLVYEKEESILKS